MNILSESEITLEAKIESIPKFTEFVDAKLEELGFPMKSAMQVDIVLDEILSNVSFYAYADKDSTDGDCLVTLGFASAIDPQCILIKFIDKGVPYNPLEKDDPDITLSAEERAIGGLGIFMTKQFADSLTYERSDDQNILTFQKNY